MYLIPGAQRLDHVDLVAVCGRDPERAAAAARVHKIANSYVSVEQMLRSEDLHGVIIATPPEHHEAAARTVSKFNVSVMCEKPLALDQESARQIRDLLRGRPALTGFTLRWQPLYRTLHAAIDSGAVGQVKHLRMHYVQTFAATPARAWNWHFDVSREPLGVVSDLGPHAIDLIRWLLGEVKSVYATARTTIPRRVNHETGHLFDVTNIDDADVYIETVNGSSASLTISRVAPGEGSGSISIDVLGDHGWIRGNSADATELVMGTAAGIEPIVMENRPFLESASDQIRDFVAASRGDLKINTPSIEDGYQAQLVVEAIGKSIARQKLIEISGRQ
jgi:Predicted dehydrogenases and related proteins